MFLRRSALGLTLLTLGLLAAEAVQAAAAPARLVQLPGSTPEPPLPGQLPAPPAVAPPAAPVPALPAPPVFAPEQVVAPPPTLAAGEPPVPVVALRVRVPACAAEGQELKYLICADNTSPAPAHHVRVRVPLPAGTRLQRAEPPATTQQKELAWDLGTLPGLCCKEIWLVLQPLGTDDIKLCARVQFEHGQCVCTRIARAAPAPGTRMPYAEERPGQGAGPEKTPAEKTPGEKGPAEKGPPPGQAQLDLKINGPKAQMVGQPAVYTITLTNPGTGPASKTLITVQLPAATTFVAASEGGRQVVDQVAWLVGDLAAGASRTVELTLKATARGKHCVQVSALANTDLSAHAEFCTTFQGATAVLFKMADTRDPIAVGEETSYLIEVISQGSLPVTNVRIRAILPDEMALVRTKGPTESHKGARVKEGQEILFDAYPSLAPEGRIVYEVFVKALRPGDLRFRAILTADQLQAGGPVLEEESTRVFLETSKVLEMRRRSRAR